MLCACTSTTSERPAPQHALYPRIERIAIVARSWHLQARSTPPAALWLLRDGAPFSQANLAVARSIQHSNRLLAPFDALQLADLAISAAREADLDPDFFCATILQESAFDPNAFSSAGAVGIAQFEISTADANGVDPFDPQSALRGAALLISDYLNRYRNVYPDPYAAALAAYNAGPEAVSAYHGVPPYVETRDYIGYVYERWARLLSDTSTSSEQLQFRKRRV